MLQKWDPFGSRGGLCLTLKEMNCSRKLRADTEKDCEERPDGKFLLVEIRTTLLRVGTWKLEVKIRAQCPGCSLVAVRLPARSPLGG